MTKVYQGFTITFPTPDKPRFHVELDGENRWLDSYDQAVAAIKTHIAHEAKASIAGLQIAHVALTEDGQAVKVTGINRANGEAKVEGYINPKRRRWERNTNTYDGYLYPDVDWIPEALERMKELREIESRLSYVRTRGKRGSGYGLGRISATAYPNRLKEFEEELIKAKAKAEEYAKKEEAA